jgi:hypothetical protein
MSIESNAEVLSVTTLRAAPNWQPMTCARCERGVASGAWIAMVHTTETEATYYFHADCASQALLEGRRNHGTA